ncbi:hypothetical protein BDV34DRAFT_194140 [Aspergillus parasiticus]|uniref:Uncharacterized protein n=1 Tax=Aspergillus parasiticus TaxID=5067 RepID=A0A5N6DMD9_ASPPA|nr:hypothetical protein BDV34DRAFT_194140 [Aspergillus parasiticus]
MYKKKRERKAKSILFFKLVWNFPYLPQNILSPLSPLILLVIYILSVYTPYDHGNSLLQFLLLSEYLNCLFNTVVNFI